MKNGPLTFLSVGIFILISCSETPQETPQSRESARTVTETLPGDLNKGEALFNANCSGCHGKEAKGTEKGPPLVHKIYEPNHHSDASFYLAAQKGVRAHHWKFGDMPPVSGVKREDVAEIIAYVRWLQRQAGIF